MYLCPLFSGSSGNATLVEAGGSLLLIDAGKSARAIASALEPVGLSLRDLWAVLITHEHIDHVAGIGTLSRRYHIPIYANADTWRAMPNSVGEIPPECMRVFETGRDFFMGEVNIMPFAIHHDAADPVGFSLCHGSRKLTVMTDTGHLDERLIAQAAGSDLLLIEANHDPGLVQACSYPYRTKRRILSDMGHLSNEACGRALCRLYSTGVRNVILGHLSRENNFEHLALETVKEVLSREGIPPFSYSLCAAHYDRVTGKFTVEENV